MESTPTSPRSVIFSDYHIDGEGSSSYRDEMIESKIQSILDESIVQHLISTVSSEGAIRFTYHLVEEMTDGDAVAQPNLVITGDKGDISLGTLHANLGRKLSPGSPSTPMIEACIKVEDMVQDLLNSLHGTSSRVAPPPYEDSSEALAEEQERSRALADRVARLEAENDDFRGYMDDYVSSAESNAAQLMEAVTTIDTLEAKNEALTAENTALRGEVTDLTDQLTRSRYKRTQLQERVDAHTPVVDALEARITYLQGQVQDQTALKTRVREQEEELSALKAQDLVPKADLDEQATRISKLEAKLAANARLVAESAHTAKELQKATDASVSAKTQIKQLGVQVKAKDDRIKLLERTVESRTGQIATQHQAHRTTLESTHRQLVQLDTTSTVKVQAGVDTIVQGLAEHIGSN